MTNIAEIKADYEKFCEEVISRRLPVTLLTRTLMEKIERLISVAEAAERQMDEAVKALEWYGDEEPYAQKSGWLDDEEKDIYWEAPDILEDRGELARTTIKRIKGAAQAEGHQSTESTQAPAGGRIGGSHE
ncbi:hypothetical protein [Paenibacillus sp. FSL R7-0128]|uniref:hypothetical protein n=1 Tax=Paenibacillus sp. FSL R7-0128 TaxID=2954529 RepID=UPI0030F4FE57